MQILAALFSAIVFVANQGSHSVSAIDVNARTERTLAIPIAPHNVQMCGPKVLLAVGFLDVSGSYGMVGEPGRLLSIDPKALRVRSGIDIGSSPAHVVCDSKGRLAYVTLSGENAVAVVDVASMRRLAKIPVGRYPHGLRMSSDDRTLFVANVRDDDISVVDVRARRLVRNIAVGGSPNQVAVSPDGKMVYATLSNTNEVVRVNVAQGRVTKRLRLGLNPAQVTITNDGKELVVANEGTLDSPGSDVVIVDAATLLPIAAVTVANGPYGVAIDGRRAYVTSVFSGALTSIDLVRHRAIRTYTVGAEPAGVTVYP